MSGSLTHSPSDVIRYLLIDLGLGTAPSAGQAWPVHVEREPASPDSVLTVYTTQGRTRGRTQRDGIVQEHYGIQIRVRDARPETGHVKANAVACALDTLVKRNTVTIGAQSYLVEAVTRTGAVLSGKDAPSSNRYLFTVNALASIQPLN